MRSECPVCSSSHSRSFFASPSMPVQASQLIYERNAALSAPMASIDLALCPDCGLIYNRRFDPALVTYDDTYDNSLHFSPRFQEYQSCLIDQLIERYGLRAKNILEVGCGDGEFLLKLCAAGGNAGIGFDPACRDRATPAGVQLVSGYYKPSAMDRDLDFVCCRHVLEHVDAPLDFLASIREGIGPDAGRAAYFEVPNSQRMLEQGALWDLVYEHFSYYTPSSLASLLSRAGFAVESLTAEYDDQFLSAFTHTGYCDTCDVAAEEGARLEVLADTFSATANLRLAGWQDTLQRLIEAGRRTAVWGAGAKGVTFLNLVPAAREIETVIDVNPRKHESFVPGSGHCITSPKALLDAPPDTILLMNGIYQDEVQRTLSELCIEAELIVA